MSRILICTVIAVCLTACEDDPTHSADSTLSDAADDTPTQTDHELSASSWEGQLDRADIAFVGSVERIEYRMSAIDGMNDLELAHTFVTFRVLEPVKGGAVDDEVTLRFLGGHVGGPIVSVISDQPLFDIGDTDLLLVQDNGKTACPLVDCIEGRYRIANGALYADDGREIWTDANGSPRKGERVDLPETRSYTIAGFEIEQIPEILPGQEFIAQTYQQTRLDEVRPVLRAVSLRSPAVTSTAEVSLNADMPFSIYLDRN